MLSDEQARSLLHTAGDTIGVLPNARPITSRRRKWPLLAAAASVVLVVGGVVVAHQIAADPGGANLVTREPTSLRSAGGQPAPMTADPIEGQPGDPVTITFGVPVTRGTAYYLTSEQDGSSYTLYAITSSGGGSPSWARGKQGIPAIGVIGPGPDHVAIPDVATSGTYELCAIGAADSGEDLCVQLIVE